MSRKADAGLAIDELNTIGFSPQKAGLPPYITYFAKMVYAKACAMRVIDRSIRKATSRFHASVCACHHLLVNDYRSQLASVSSDRSAQSRPCLWLEGVFSLRGHRGAFKKLGGPLR
jgi:hypothetical protein